MRPVQLLKQTLAANYKALGFELLNFEQLKTESFNVLIRFTIRCPCGGYEHVNLVPDQLETKEDVHRQAADLLMATAGRHHFQKDVDEGKLPPFDIEKHIFKTLIKVAA